MSLIIGIRCSEGVVVGTDSAATFGGIGRNTIRQTARKLQIVDEKAVIACAGPAGLAQRYHGVLKEILNHETLCVPELPPHKLMGCLHENFLDATRQQLDSLAAAKDFFGLSNLSGGLGGTIVAMMSAGSIALFSFDDLCTAEQATTDLPFVSIGSGQAIADPFLAFLKRVLWKNKAPTLALGVLSTIWTLDHAIETNPGGVAGPLHVVTMALNESSEPVIVQLQDAVIDDHRQQLEDAEAKIGETLRRLESASAPEPPKAK